MEPGGDEIGIPGIEPRVPSIDPLGMDIDGDGKVSPWERHLCKLCLFGALLIAFGDKITTVLL